MGNQNARIIEKDIMTDLVDAEGGDSEIVDLNRASKFSCQAVYDVSSPSAKTFDSPQFADLVNQSLTYTSLEASEDANDISIEILVPASGTHALAVSTVGDAISVSLESSAVVAATGVLNLTADITLTSVAAGAARNTQTFQTQVLAAAANPTDTVIVGFTGTAAAIVCTITPNDGTNNGAVPVDLTTAELTELVNTGAVVGKTITITGTGSFRTLQTASGGDATPFADGGEGDGVTATFSGGADFDATISTGDDVKALINADPDASLLVLVSGSNAATLVGLVETNLAGGTDGEVDVAESEVTIPTHGYSTGLKVQLTTTGTLPDPLTTATDYFIIVVDANTIQFAETEQDAEDGVAIELTDTGADGSVNTVTAVALAGASVTFQKSNDGETWIDIEAATSISADGSVLLQQPNVSYRYFKAVKGLTSGIFNLKCLTLVVGDPM